MFFTSVIKIVTAYWPSFLLGSITTLKVAIIGTLIGFVLGLLIGGFKAIQLDYTAGRAKRILFRLYKLVADIYITVLRGTPMMVQAMFFYYALLGVFHWDKMTAGMFVISINTSAYMAEIIRSGIQSVDKGQTEAARSLGMSNAQTLLSIILPQAIRNAFPAIGNELIVNIKDSSVLMIISITDLMFQAKSIAGTTFKTTATFFVTAMIYLFMNLIATVLLNLLENRLNRTNTITLPMSSTDPKSMKYATIQDEVNHDR